MPALFAYFLVVSIVLGGGYAGLRWLSVPPDARSSQRPAASEKLPARKHVAEETRPAAANPAEKGPNDQPEKDMTASPSTSEPSIKAPVEPSPNETTASGTQDADNVPPGGCMPIGWTAHGELVFPFQCKELLERYRGPLASQDSVLTNSIGAAPAPKKRQAPEPAQSPSNNTNAKVEDVSPSGEAKPGNQNSEPEAMKENNGRRRGIIGSSHSRNEEQWFNPLTFR